MQICPVCTSVSNVKKGKEYTVSGIKQRYKCKSCSSNFYDYSNPTNIPKTISSKKTTWVITSAINDTPVNYNLLKTLKSYCLYNDAELMVIPIKYHMDQLNYSWSDSILEYIVDTNIQLLNDLKVLAHINVSPTTANPLSGFDAFSKGCSLIIPSPQIMMKTVAINHVAKPAILYTTGCITEPLYTSSKAGEKAVFNHSFAALVVEQDDEIDSFHIRVLNSDASGEFYDIDKFYSGYTIEDNTRIPGIVLGDEHVAHIDASVESATFDPGQICDTLNPEYIIRHDILDFYSASHHHKNDFFTNYKKYIKDTNNVSVELEYTLKYILDTTPDTSVSVIVDSNHNQHLDTWLNSIDIRREPWNAKLFHKLMYLKLESIDADDTCGAFELWCNDKFKTADSNIGDKIIFIENTESFKMFDIELGLHGDRGLNGSRGSSAQFSRLGEKTIVGHSHSPAIYNGCYTVGHSSVSKLEYNKGPSSWHQAHCIIQPNGKRQLIFITKGKWRK